MYTPPRLKPRIFPVVVSATVAGSEAMTVEDPQPPAVDFVFGGPSVVSCAIAAAGRMFGPPNPTAILAMLPMNERLPLEASVRSRFNLLLTSLFNISSLG